VGRTLQMWNRYRQSVEFCDGKRWLLRFFDQLRFYRYPLRSSSSCEPTSPMGKCGCGLSDPASTARLPAVSGAQRPSIQAFKARQQAAFETNANTGVCWASRKHRSQAPTRIIDRDRRGAALRDQAVPPGCVAICSPVSGSVWKIATTVGATVIEHSRCWSSRR